MARHASVPLLVAILGACAGSTPPSTTDTSETVAPPDTGSPTTVVDADNDGIPADEDCDDTDPAIGIGTPTYADEDEDGYGDPATEMVECDPSPDRVANGQDCDDSRAEISPDGIEICDGADNDCDPSTSESGMVHRTTLDGTIADDAATWTAGADGAPAALVLKTPATYDLCDVHAYVSLEVETDVTLRGHGTTVLDGGGVGRVFYSHTLRGSAQAPGQIVTLSNLTVRGGVGNNGGCGYSFRSEVVLTDVTVEDCLTESPSSNGGGLLLDDSRLTVSGGTFTNNGARRGGALYGTGAIGTITGTTFSGNGPANHGADANLFGEGGAIRWAGDSLELDGATFSDHMSNRGGAVFLTTVDLTAVDTTFERNSATQTGGALWVSDAVARLEGGTLTDNHADTAGGAVYLEVSTLLSTGGTTFSDNDAGTDGGAIYGQFSNSRVDLDGATVERNSAVGDGGALWLDDDMTTTIENSTLTDNTAIDGGGVYFSGGTFTMTGNTWTTNHATGAGGALYTEAPGNDGIVSATGEDFVDNTPTDHRHAQNAADHDWGLGASFVCDDTSDSCN